MTAMRRFVLLALLPLVLPSLAAAAVFVVAPDGTGDFPTIQAAIDAAADGDAIRLADGTFKGDGNRDLDYGGKALLIYSESGDPETCILDCEGSESEPHRGFWFHSGEDEGSVLEAVTITRGWDEFRGGAILCEESTSPTIWGCVLTDNKAPTGAGMCGGDTPTLVACRFEGNSGTRGGGLAQVHDAQLIDCVFADNVGRYGGGIYIRSSCSPTLTGCVFSGNIAEHSGAAMHIEQHCYPAIDFCTFSSNTSPIGGAIDVSIECAPTFTNCTFWGNGSGYTAVVTCYDLSLPRRSRAATSMGTREGIGSAVSLANTG